jgi:crotonobetainyl-CoA:carnitine CoA-transferase CaiB-like acyl-CoA transferase
MAGMLQADMGADVICINQPEEPAVGQKKPLRFDIHKRGRQRIAVNPKKLLV